MGIVEELRARLDRQSCLSLQDTLRAELLDVSISKAAVASTESQAHLIDSLALDDHVVVNLCSKSKVTNAHFPHALY